MKSLIQYNNIKFSQKITLLVCSFLLCFIVTIMLNTLIMTLTGTDSMLYINLSITTQNILTFILPVVITLAFISPKPLEFIQIGNRPSLKSILMMITLYIAMTPALNYIVEWNESLSLPESMKAIETWMRNAEDSARAVTDKILNENNIILSILLVGILTGLGEEVFFRGGLQRIFLSRPINAHVAIWVTAFIFSAMHFQFFGFFPRLIIGAFFGYLAYWSGSLWTAVFAHALNNSTVIVATAISTRYSFNLDTIGTVPPGEFPFLATTSLLLTIAIIKYYPKKSVTE